MSKRRPRCVIPLAGCARRQPASASSEDAALGQSRGYSLSRAVARIIRTDRRPVRCLSRDPGQSVCMASYLLVRDRDGAIVGELDSVESALRMLKLLGDTKF